MLQREMTLEDYKAIFFRRIWVVVIPAVALAVLAFTISLFLPARYTSETVVLVEEPTVPENFVKPVIGGDVNRRLATMQEQILSRTRLQQIIEKFGLDREDTGHAPMEELVVRLRKNITVSPVRPMAETRASGLPGFTVSVVAREAYLAQQICSEITSFFMQQNVLLRQRRAEDTTEFLTTQLEDSKRKLDEQDAKLAVFQRHYMGELPDQMQTNFSVLTGLSSQLEAASQALNRAQQDKIFVQSMLDQQQAAAKASSQIVADPEMLQKQLATLQEQLATLRAHYTEQHPDVRKVKKDIAQLEKVIGTPSAVSQDAKTAHAEEQNTLESPQVRQWRAQLQQLEVTIRDKTAQQAEIQDQINKLQGRLQLTPSIAQEYKALTRDYQTALNIYNDLLKKQSESEMATDLERRQEGEQFRVLDAPSLPEKPSFPNHLVFCFGGFFGGLGLGLGIAFLLEAQDTALHTERDVERLLKLPTLAMIPVFEPRKSNGVMGMYPFSGR
jgi:polysaccharide chain length determinant protein (PEP-CTERM system associated)